MGQRLELMIFQNLLFNEEYTRRTLPFLKEEYFNTDATDKVLFRTIQSYVLKYSNLPTVAAIDIELSERNDITEEQYTAATAMLKAVEKRNKQVPADDMNWLIDSTEKFCQDKALYNAITQAISIFDESTRKNAAKKDSIPSILSDALGVSFDSHVGHDFLENAESRFDFYHRKEERIPFDLDYFNRITNGGIPKKSLSICLAGVHVGKSLFMCHCAAANLSNNSNVLYITLEMAEERIAERIDANLLNVQINSLLELPKETYLKRMNALKKRVKGKLIIKEFPTATANVNHLRALLEELRIKRAFTPDIIYVDYLNLMTSTRFTNAATANSYSIVKSIGEELRGLAVEYNLPIVSATQVNRTGFQSTDVGMEDVSESFGIPAIADFFFALISTEELEEYNQIKVKQLKNRFGNVSTNRSFVIGVDRSRMRLYDVEQEAQDELIDNKDTNVFDKATNNAFGRVKPSSWEEFNNSNNNNNNKHKKKRFDTITMD